MSEPLHRRGWLWEFLERYAQAYDPAKARAALPGDCFDPTKPSLQRCKLALRTLMGTTGLRYGMPLKAEELVTADRAPEEALFLTALARQFDLCGAAAAVVGKELSPRDRSRDLLT